ncbi:MAG: hypothetical protein PHI11_13125 [Gallionella sp.]|nr:hypothetical protein [Gallionella sp.]
MAQFIAFEKDAEVAGHAILTCLNCFPEYFRADVERLLKEKNIVDIAPIKWFNLQNYLDVLKEVSTRYGANTLFNVGVAIGEGAPSSPETTLQSALAAWDALYRSHHHNAYLGYIKLLSFDNQAKKAVVEVKTPYPCHFERGLATALARKFKPQDAGFIDVQLDKSKPSRLDGADSSFYVIYWI